MPAGSSRSSLSLGRASQARPRCCGDCSRITGTCRWTPRTCRAAFAADPRSLFRQYPPPAIFDEVQHVPELLAYVKEQVDSRRHRSGQYVLAGSQNILLMERVAETLAGRAAILRLLPFSQRELDRGPTRRLPWEIVGGRRRSLPKPDFLWRTILRGGYPDVALDAQRDFVLWQRSYMQTYVERDLRTLRQVGDLTQFQDFLRALARRSSRRCRVGVGAARLRVAVCEAVALRTMLGNVRQAERVPAAASSNRIPSAAAAAARARSRVARVASVRWANSR